MTRKHGMDIHDPAIQKLLEKPYICEVCGEEAFACATSLLQHYKEDHTDQNPPESLQTQAKVESKPMTLSVPSLSNQDDAMSYGSEMSEDKQSFMQDFDEDEDEEMLQLDDKLVSKMSTPISVTPDAGSPVAHAIVSSSPIALEISPIPSPAPQANGSDRSTSCWKCGLNFPTRRALLKHLKEHSIDNPFKCYQCDASYKTRHESLQHTMAIHPIEWEALKDKNRILSIEAYAKYQESTVGETISQILETYGEAVAEPPTEDSPGNKEADYLHRKVYCSYCPKRFWSLQDLRRHMRSHTGERPFECSICHRKFTLKHSMMRHLKTHGASAADAVVESKEEVTGRSETEDDDEAEQMEDGEEGDKSPKESAVGTDKSCLLNSLLGVEDCQLNQMLDSADSAAKMLGM